MDSLLNWIHTQGLVIDSQRLLPLLFTDGEIGQAHQAWHRIGSVRQVGFQQAASPIWLT